MLTPEQQTALDAMLSGANVFLTGHAGTGKSFVVQRFKKESQGAVFLAPTGLAALNIGGSTIHRFFGLPIGPLQPKALYQLSTKAKSAIRQARSIVIDEISMVRADLMQAVDERCRQATEVNKPFGGKQLIVVGDFYQLAPVVAKKEEEIWLLQNFGGPFAFNARAWKRAGFQLHDLKKSHRHVGDDGFITALNQVREGDIEGLAFINTNALTKPDAKALVLCTTNRTAEDCNATALARLNGVSVDFQAQLSGSFRPADAPAPLILSLKPGARVMVVANLEHECVNGDCGEVAHVADEVIQVKLDSGREVKIQRKIWQAVEYTLIKSRGGSHLEPRVVGSFVQFPLRLGWAITIHKSQGQTLANVSLDLGRGTFAEGQLYVGLSRVRSIDTLHLHRHLCAVDLIVSQAVCDFFASLQFQDSNQNGWGGQRENSGRISYWPDGTVLKTMRLPAILEEEIKRFALEKITNVLGA